MLGLVLTSFLTPWARLRLDNWRKQSLPRGSAVCPGPTWSQRLWFFQHSLLPSGAILLWERARTGTHVKRRQCAPCSRHASHLPTALRSSPPHQGQTRRWAEEGVSSPWFRRTTGHPPSGTPKGSTKGPKHPFDFCVPCSLLPQCTHLLSFYMKLLAVIYGLIRIKF